MLEIRMNQVIYVQENLEQQLVSLNNQIWEIEQVMQRLNYQSGMEGSLAGLRRQKDRLAESKRTLDRMVQCLEKMILYYNSCENRICDYALQEVVVYRRHVVGINNLQNISGLLQSVI
ncbi:MAG: hypothetical protein IJO85_08160 [Lachnospiraceae bacterium]|nr:hypothetical protein [Lachnospiraceae bacterium]